MAYTSTNRKIWPWIPLNPKNCAQIPSEGYFGKEEGMSSSDKGLAVAGEGVKGF